MNNQIDSKMMKLVQIAEQLYNSGAIININYWIDLHEIHDKIMNQQEYEAKETNSVSQYVVINGNDNPYYATKEIIQANNYFGWNQKVQLVNSNENDKFYMMKFGNIKYALFKLNDMNEIISIDIEWNENDIIDDMNNIIDNNINNNINNNIIIDNNNNQNYCYNDNNMNYIF